jgi:hypothetical protein
MQQPAAAPSSTTDSSATTPAPASNAVVDEPQPKADRN